MSGETSGYVRQTLRLEGLCVLVLATLLYGRAGYAWSQYIFLFLAPDLALIGYLAGRKAGAITYNLTHSYVGPILLTMAALAGAVPYAKVGIGLIWAAHIGFDRLLGFGLKYESGFDYTHLGRLGRAKTAG